MQIVAASYPSVPLLFFFPAPVLKIFILNSKGPARIGAEGNIANRQML